jgi:hypothetical protein
VYFTRKRNNNDDDDDDDDIVEYLFRPKKKKTLRDTQKYRWSRNRNKKLRTWS